MGRGRRRETRLARAEVMADSSSQACHWSDALDDGAGARYILLRMAGNDKFLAPREQGVVYAAVRRRFRVEGTAPLSRIAWRVVPQRNGWVQLQHVLTGRWMRLVPPPSPVQWVVRAEVDPAPYGKQTWFRLESSSGGAVDLAAAAAAAGGSPVEAHVRCHVTGAYLNYRGRPVPTEEDFVRGHGNAMQGNQWVAAPRAPSTKLLLESLSAADVRADAARWEDTRRGCLAPCSNATAAAERARTGGVGWSEVCWKHYAEATCSVLLRVHGPRIGDGGGAEAHLLKARWARLDCEKYVERPKPPPPALLSPAAIAAEIARRSAAGTGAAGTGAAENGAAGTGAAGTGAAETGAAETGAAAAASPRRRRPHCAPLGGERILLLLVSDRPNQFLCHYFESAALHGLSPTVLGWDDSGWASGDRKPWTYYLGGKLVLPLDYLERCGYPDDALVLFTDHDVVFQGGYAELKQRYAKAVAAAAGAPLIFSAEKESYPRELQGLYPRTPSDPSRGPAEYLNSGMWMGPVGAAKALLRVMTGVYKGESMERLLRHYHFWGRLDTRRDPIPPAYNENDQVKYAGLYVAQELRAQCAATGGRGGGASSRGGGCFRFLHDNEQRCANSCRGTGASHLAGLPRMGLDRSLQLFENMYHAGSHSASGRTGRLAHRQAGSTPLILHFNGPAKVIFEREWGLPQWDAAAGKTPVLHLVEGLRKGMSAHQRRAATAAFDRNVTFLDPWLQRTDGQGPLRYSCDVPW